MITFSKRKTSEYKTCRKQTLKGNNSDGQTKGTNPREKNGSLKLLPRREIHRFNLENLDPRWNLEICSQYWNRNIVCERFVIFLLMILEMYILGESQV